MKTSIPKNILKKRRDSLINQIGDSIIILPAASEKVRNRDCNFIFRQDSDFLYLTGFNEPDAILVLCGKTKKSILFSKKLDKKHTIWEGEIIGQDRAKSEYLFDESYSLEESKDKIQSYIYSNENIIFPFSKYEKFDSFVLDLIRNVKETRRAKSPQTITHSDTLIHPMRLVKDEYEIEMMTYAAKISVQAHKIAMQKTKPNMNESEVASFFDAEFSKVGGFPAYSHIVAGGNNACTLHYTNNNKVLKDGDLILIDAGCEHEGYAGDITRTYPVNGKFTEIQKKVYNWVLKALDAALLECKPGNTIRSPHFAAENVLIDAMIDLNLLNGTREEIKTSESYEKYFMHGTSHWLGLDVHDAGEYKTGDNWTTLPVGCVITVEPGIYIRADDMDAPEELRGIGIRIEDDILITADGYLNLTADTPKTISDIEGTCNI